MERGYERRVADLDGANDHPSGLEFVQGDILVKILDKLQENGHRPLSGIAKEVGLALP